MCFRRPAKAVTILKVEPGGSPLTARLTSGSASSFRSSFQSFALMLGMKVFGSNDGTEAMARMFAVVRIDHHRGAAAEPRAALRR